ncbi:MAG: TlpA family protein disulfide reductase [Flavobacteriaceae bacterium]|nr:TlpA family protein disulfide reductase [Flavobacteriaceae bacterium]
MRKLLTVLLFIPLLSLSQQKIKGTFSPAFEYDWILIYKVTPTHSNYVGDARVDEKGIFEFELDSTQMAGMYRIVYAVPQEEYNFDIIYNARENIEFTFNSETGLEYQESNENKLMSSYTNSMAMVSQSIGNFYNQKSTDSTALMSIFQTQKETQKEFENISEGTIASHFIKANRPYIPESFQDIQRYISNIRTHFFDHVDFNNEVLQSSNFLVERTLNFVFGLVAGGQSDAEMYKQNIVDVASAMEKASLQTRKMLLHIVWRQLSEANYEEVANFITDQYLLSIAKELNDSELINEITSFKNISRGEIAPDFDIDWDDGETKEKKKLSELDIADNYIVVFWSSGCSHCLEELPQLRDFIKSVKDQKLKVIAVGLEDDEYRWKTETYEYPEFIHVIGLGKWDNEIGNKYNITSTPTYFILDRDKKIIAKPKAIDDLKDFVSAQK